MKTFAVRISNSYKLKKVTQPKNRHATSIVPAPKSNYIVVLGHIHLVLASHKCDVEMDAWAPQPKQHPIIFPVPRQ